ncbi:hypothetical protein D3C80_1713070 [compost metagenome]
MKTFHWMINWTRRKIRVAMSVVPLVSLFQCHTHIQLYKRRAFTFKWKNSLEQR